MATVTNKDFAQNDINFRSACRKAAEVIEPDFNKRIEKNTEFNLMNVRQASKFRKGKGIVWKVLHNLV